MKRAILLMALTLAGLPVFAQRPAMVILETEMPETLDWRSKKIVEDFDFSQLLREALLTSRSFSVMVRDDASAQAILKEKKRSESSIARGEAPEEIGFDIAGYFSQPVVRKFKIDTSYEAMEMLPDMYERKDSVKMEFSVKIFDVGGNYVFEKTVDRVKHFPAKEADEDERRRNAVRSVAAIQSQAADMMQEIVDGIVTRINPITVLDVRGDILVIDRGENNGFDESTEFLVYGTTKEVENPNTGEVHRIPGMQLGRAKIERLHEDFAEVRLLDPVSETIEVGATLRAVKEGE